MSLSLAQRAAFAMTGALLAGCVPRTAGPTHEAVTWSDADRDLRLGLAIHGERAIVVLENTGASPLTVIAAGGLSLHVEGGGTSRELTMGKGGPIFLDRPSTFATLAPHARLERVSDLGTLPPAHYRVSAAYGAQTAAIGSWWNGLVHAGPVDVDIE